MTNVLLLVSMLKVSIKWEARNRQQKRGFWRNKPEPVLECA